MIQILTDMFLSIILQIPMDIFFIKQLFLKTLWLCTEIFEETLYFKII